jgi:hypothetical protein
VEKIDVEAYTCILTETMKIYQEKCVGLKKRQWWYHRILYLKSTNCHMMIFLKSPKHWIYMDTGYCNSFSFSLWLYNYWEYVIECVYMYSNWNYENLPGKMCRIEKKPVMISPYPIFEVEKLPHDDIFKILNINHIFNIICASTAKTHSITYSQ